MDETMNSYYKCASGGRFVTIWPSVTGERHFYDVVSGADDEAFASLGDGNHTVTRVTVTEAAAIVLTELGTPVKTTVDSLAGMIRRWRDDFDSQDREPIRS